MRRGWLILALALAGCDGDEAASTVDMSAVDDAVVDMSPIDDAARADMAPADADAPEAGPPPLTGELSTALSPTFPPEYYVEQALLYFDTLDIEAPRENVPVYSPLVARWEWPPWLYLTGYEAGQMIASTRGALLADPSTVPIRDCRFFDTQPFARCYVVFRYDEGDCPIYEEFTFNDAGEMTFIEAWSDLPGWLPFDREADMWAEQSDIGRLSTKVPGLGNAEGRIDLRAQWMLDAAATDDDVADFVRRASDFWTWWRRAFDEAGPELYATGCGWDHAKGKGEKGKGEKGEGGPE